VDKLFLLVSKQFRMVMRDISLADKFDMSMEEHLDLRLCASPLERIGDHAAKMCAMVELIGYKSVPDETVEEIAAINRISMKIVSDAVDALFKKNLDLAHATFAMKKDAMLKLQASEEKILTLDSSISVPLGIVLDSIDRVCDYGCNIAEIAINSSVASR
jgi:phosphate uptake regulator